MTSPQKREEFGYGKLVKVGQGVPAPFPAKSLGLEALSVAGGAEIVGTVARKKNAHVHLVGGLFEPAEKSFHAIPGARPFFAVFAVTRFAIDHEGLLFGRESGEGDVGGDFLPLGENAQIFLRRAVDFAFPTFE